MALNYDRIMSHEFPEVTQTYGRRDTMLYALGLGVGADPVAPEHLQFVFEKGLRVLPTMAVVLAAGRLPFDDFGINRTMLVHGEQSIAIAGLPPPEGTVVGRTRVLDIIDKGADKGAILYTERTVSDRADGALLATLGSAIFLRGDGGFGGQSGPTPPAHQLPDTPPQQHCDIATLPQAALIYRLSGDYNPLHADPEFAAAARFDRPILHGLCTYGVVGRALLELHCGHEPARLKSMQARFSRPVFPGETIRTETWAEGAVVSFRARVVERDAVVLNNGRAEIGG